MALLNGARLSVLRKNSDEVIREVLIRTSQIKFGSEVNCTIRLKSELTEKLHCKIFVKNEKVFIANYSSKNPISVDEKVILKRAVLSDGCLIEICRTRFRWSFDASLLQARMGKVKRPERTPTSSKFGKPRRTTLVRKKQIIEQAEPAVGSSGRKSGPKKSQKTPTYTLPKNNKQLMKNIKKRFTMHSVMVDNNSDDDEEMDSEDHDKNESAVAESNIHLDVTDTPRKLVTTDTSKNNTPFYTPDTEKENQTPVAVGKTPGTPKGLNLQLENSAMMILSYTPVVGPRSKANVAKTPLSSNKKATHGLRSGFLTPKNDNILTVATTLNSPNVSKVGASMYLIDLTTPTSKNGSFVSNRSDQSFSSSAGLIDLTTPPSKKPKTPSSAVIKSSQKGLLRSALKNASKTPLSALRSRHAAATPKQVAKSMLEDSVSKSPKTPTKSVRTPLIPASGSKSKTRSQAGTPVMNKTFDSPVVVSSCESQTPQKVNEHDGGTETPKEAPAMTTDELFDTLVGRPSIKKTYARKSESPKKLPSPLVPAEDGSSELPPTDIDIWVDSVVAAVTSPEPLDAECFRKMPNRTTQVRSSQYSDITPHESFTDAPVAVAPEMPSTDESQEKTDLDEVSAMINAGELGKQDNSNPAWTRRSHTPLASKIVRSLGNKRQTIGNFFTNMFGKLTVSPVTRVSITDGGSDEVTEETHDLDRSSEPESEISEEEYHDSESDQQVEVVGQFEDINPSPKLRQSLRDTRKFIGNALTSLNTSKLTLDNSVEIDESLLLNGTYDENLVDQSELAEENYDLTDLSARPVAATLGEHSNPSTSTRKSARKVAHSDFRSEISPMDNETHPLSPRVVHQTRASISVSTPSARRRTRQTLDVDISPLAVPLQVTPVKEPRKSVVESSMTEQETSTGISDEPLQSPVITAGESVLMETSPETSPAITENLKRSSRKSIVQKPISDTAASAEALKDRSIISDTEPSDVGNVASPMERTESVTPLRSRLSKRVSRHSTAKVEGQQLEPAEESIQDELDPSADVSSVDHIVNQVNQSVTESTASKHTSRSRRATVSALTPLQEEVAMDLANPEPTLGRLASDKRITRKSLAVTIASSPTARQKTTSTMLMSESKIPLRGNRSVQRLPTGLRLKFNDSSIDNELISSPVETATESPSIGEGNAAQNIVLEMSSPTTTSSSDSPDKVCAAGDNEELMEANHDSLSTSTLGVVDREETNVNEDDLQDQSTISETVANTSVRRGRSSLQLRQTSTSGNDSDRLSASVGKPVRKPAQGTPLLRKAIFAMCTPSRSSGSSDSSESVPAMAGTATAHEMTPVRVESKPETPARSSRRSTIDAKESTPVHRKPGIETENESGILDMVASIGSPNEQASMPAESLRESLSASSPMIHTPRTRGMASPASTRKSQLIAQADKSVSSPIIEETHDSIVEQETQPEVFTPSDEEGENVEASSNIESTPEQSIEVRSRESRSRKSTGRGLQSTVNAETSAIDALSIENMDESATVPSTVEQSIVEEPDVSITELDIPIPSEETSATSGGAGNVSKVISTPEHSSSARASRSSKRSTIVSAGSTPADKKAATVEQLSESIVEQPDESVTEPEVSTPSKETSVVISGDTATVNDPEVVSTPEHSNSVRASRSTRRSTIVSDGSADKIRASMVEQLSESIVEEPDASIIELEVLTPYKETSVTSGDAANDSEVVSTPEHSSSARASRSSRRSTITTADKRTTIGEQLSSSVVAQLDTSKTEPEVPTPSKETSITSGDTANASEVLSTPEQSSSVRTSRSTRRSTIVSADSTTTDNKTAMVEQLSDSIVAQLDESVTEPEVSTPSKGTSVVVSGDTATGNALEVVSTPEHCTPVRASRSTRRSTIVSDSSADKRRTTLVEQLSESIVKQPDEHEDLTPSKETSVTSRDVVNDSEVVSSPEHSSSARGSRSSMRSTITTAEKRATIGEHLSLSIIAKSDASITEPGIPTPSKESSVSSGDAANTSEAISIPEHSSSLRASRSSRRSTIVSDGCTIADKRATIGGQHSDSIVAQPDVSISEPEVSTPSKGTSVVISGDTATANAPEVGSTPVQSSSDRASRSTRRSTIVSDGSADKGRATMVEQFSESIAAQSDASIIELEVLTPSKETSSRDAANASEVVSTPEHSSSVRLSRSSRRSTIVSDDSTTADRRATIGDQLSDSIAKHRDVSIMEPETLSPSKESFIVNVTKLDQSIEHASPVRAKESTPARPTKVDVEPVTQNAPVVSNVSPSIQSPQQTSVLTEHLHKSVATSSPVTHTPRTRRRASKVGTPLATPLLADAKHGTSTKTPASVRKSLLRTPSGTRSLTKSSKTVLIHDSVVEQQDASIAEVSTPIKETFVTSATSEVVSTPEHSSSTRRSKIVSDDSASTGSKTLLISRSADKRAGMVEQQPESIVEQPEASITQPGNDVDVSEAVSTPEHIIPARASRSSKRSTINRPADKTTTLIEQLSDSIVTQPDASITELEVSTQSIETLDMIGNAADASETMSTPERIPARASRSARRSTISRSADKTATIVEQLSQSIVTQPDASMTELEVQTPSKETSVSSGDSANASEVVSTPELSSSARASRSTRRSTVVPDESATEDNGPTMVIQLSESIVEESDAPITELEISTSSKETFDMTGNAADASEAVSTPERIPARASRSSRRSTISRSADKTAANVDQISESNVEQSDASNIAIEVSTPSEETLVSVGASEVPSTPEHSSPARASRSSRRSMVDSDDTTGMGSKPLQDSRSPRKTATIVEQLSVSIVDQQDVSVTELEVSTPSKDISNMTGNDAELFKVVSTPEHISSGRASRSARRSTIATNDSKLACRDGEPNATNELDVSDVTGIAKTPKQMEMSPGIMQTSTSALSVIHTPSTRASAKKIATSVVSTPVSVDFEHGNTVKTPASVRKSLLISRSTAKKVEQLPESIVEHLDSSVMKPEPLPPSKESFIGENVAEHEQSIKVGTPVRAEHETSIKTPASVRKSLLKTPAGTRSVTKSSITVLHEQIHDSIVEQPDESITELEIPTSFKETSGMTESGDVSKLVSTPEQSTGNSHSMRASRSSRRSTIGVTESTEISVGLQVSSQQLQSVQSEHALSDDMNESSPAASPVLLAKHTPRTSGRLSKIGTPALVVEERVRTPASMRKPRTPTAKAPVEVEHSIEKVDESIESSQNLTISEHELRTPVKETSAVASTPELSHASREAGCVTTPALDTIFKTPRPIRGTRTPLAEVKRTPVSTTKQKQLSKSAVSVTPSQETRSSRKSSHQLDTGVSCSPHIEAVHDEDLFNQTAEPSMSQATNDRRSTRFSTSSKANSPLAKVHAETSLTSSVIVGIADSSMSVTNANISATPFVIDETPIKSVAPPARKSDVSENTSSVDVCPDLLKHLCERVITLEHELDTLADDSAENTASNGQQSLDETAVNCTDTSMGIQKLLETPAATSTTRKKLRSSTVPELSESTNLEGVEQLLKTPIGKKLLRTPDTVSVGKPKAATAHADLEPTQDISGNLDGIQRLMETPVTLAVRRTKLQKHPAVDLSSSYHSTPNTSVDLEGVKQLLKTPAVSSAMKMKANRTIPDTSMQLEGIHELLKTPEAPIELQDNSPIAVEASRRKLRTSVYSANSSTHLEGVQRLLETPVASAVSPNDTFSLEGVQQMLKTPVASSSVKRILQSPTEDRTLVGDGSNLEGVEQMFKTPIAPSTARKPLRSTSKVPRTKLDESSNFEGIQQMLQTPVPSTSKAKRLRSPANDSVVDSSINLEGLGQLLESPVASTPVAKRKPDTPFPSVEVRKSLRSSTAVQLNYTDLDASSSNLQGVEESSVAISISPEKQLDATKETTINKSVDLEGVQQLLKTPGNDSVAQKLDSDKSICLESVQQLFKTPNPPSVVKRKGKSSTTAVVTRCSLDDSDALEGVQNLLKTPEISSASRKPVGRTRSVKLNDMPLDNTINMEGLQQLLKTPLDIEKKLQSTSTTHEDTVSLDGIQQLLKTPTSKRVNESQHHDGTANFEGLQSLLSTPMALSSSGITEPKSTPAVDGLDQSSSKSTPAAVATNESVSLEGIQQMLETPVVASTGKHLLKRALVNRIRGTPSNTSTNMEGIQQLLATPPEMSTRDNQTPSEDPANDSHLEGIQQLLLTPAAASVKVDVSLSDASELSTPNNTRLRRKLYTKNDPEDRTPESVKSPEMHPVTSKDYLKIVVPTAASNTRLGKKLSKPSESDNASKNDEYAMDEPIRKNPSRASKKNKSLAEEVLAGASPEVKYVKPKLPQIVEELSPTTPIEEVLVVSTSSKSDAVSQDLSAGRRKVMFNENLQIKEINSPAIVGDIIQKVSRGRGRNARKEVRVIVAEPSEPTTIKPARRATRPEDADQQPSVELIEPEVSKRPQRGVKRLIEPVEVANDNISQPEGTVDSTEAKEESKDSTVPEVSDKRELVEPVVAKRPRRGAKRVIQVANDDISQPDSSEAKEESKDSTIPEVSDKSEAEPVVKRARRAVTKSKPEAKKTSTRTKSKKVDTAALEDVEELHSEADRTTAEQIQPEPQEEIINITSPVESTHDEQSASAPVVKVPEDEQVVKRRAVTKSKPVAKKTSTRTKSKKLDTAAVQDVEELHSEADRTSAKTSEQIQPEPQEEIIDITSPVESTHDEESAPALVVKVPEDEQVVEPLSSRSKRGAKKPTTKSNRAKSSKKNVSNDDSAPTVVESVESHTTAQESTVTTNTIEVDASGSSNATEPLEEKTAPKRTKRATVATGRQRRAIATKAETSDTGSSSALTEIQEEQILVTPVLHTPIAEAPVVEQAAADSTSNDEPEPIPAKRSRGRTTRKPATKKTVDEPIAVMKESSPMPPPPAVDILPQKDISDKITAKPAPARKGRKKPVAQVEQQPEPHITEESMNESHMVRTILPATHTSTPLMQIEEENVKSSRSRARKVVNPSIAAIIAEESTPGRRSPRSRRADSESRTQDSQNVTDAEEPKTKRSRTRTVVAKMNLNDDSKDHPPAEESVPTAVEKSTEDDASSKDKKPSRAPAKRGRGKTDQPTAEPPAVVEEVVPKRIRKLPAKLQDAVPSSTVAETDTDKADAEIQPSRSRRGGTKQNKQSTPTKVAESNDSTNDVQKKSSSTVTEVDTDKSDAEIQPTRSRRGGTKQTKQTKATKVAESNENTNEESTDVQQKPSKGRKPAAKRPAAPRKKTAHVEEEDKAENDDASNAKDVQKDEEPVMESIATATTSRRRPLRSRK